MVIFERFTILILKNDPVQQRGGNAFHKSTHAILIMTQWGQCKQSPICRCRNWGSEKKCSCFRTAQSGNEGWWCELRTVASEQISCCSWMLTHVAATCPSWGWPRGALHRPGWIFDILSPAHSGHDADHRGAINTAEQNLAPPVESV